MTERSKRARPRAIVVGAGHNGLVAAFYLARGGMDTLVLERRDLVGGACVTEELFEGYGVSTCAGICWKLQDKVRRDLELERHGFAYHVLDPDPLHLHPQRVPLPIWRDAARTEAEIARLDEGDALRYRAWKEFWTRAGQLSHFSLLDEPPTPDQVRAHAAQKGELDLLERLLSVPLAEICEEFFADARVQASLVEVEDLRDPWAPGTAWLETYMRRGTSSGPSIVSGGMGGLAAAMAKAAAEAGATITTGVEVERILLDDERAHGVLLADGRELAADVVVSNADPKRTMLGMLSRGDLPGAYRDIVADLRSETGYLKFIALLRRPPDLSSYYPDSSAPTYGQLRIANSLQQYRRAHEEVTRGVPASEPIVYLHFPSRFDPALADKEFQVVDAFVRYAPLRLAEGTWADRKQEVGDRLIEWIAEFVPGFRSDVVDWMLLTPEDIEERMAISDGNIRHIDMVPGQMFGERQILDYGYRTPVEGLYLCGSGTPPGGEVTGAPGHNAAHVVLRDSAAGF